MAEVPEAAAGPPTAETRSRGTTTVADRAVERLARRFASEVPGVLRHSPGPVALSALTASLPRVSVESAGGRVRLEVDVAAEWEAGARSVAAEVRSAVGRRLAEATGMTVDRVDVTVVTLMPRARAESGGGRRVQ